MTTIVALDPGGTTGVTVLDEVGDAWTMQLGPEDHHLELYKLLTSWEPDVVVCESFMYRQNDRTGIKLNSVEYIGVAKLWCQTNNKKFVLQTPAQAKGFVTDEKLKLLNFFARAQRHANDATRHLVYYVIKNKIGEYKEWLEKAYK